MNGMNVLVLGVMSSMLAYGACTSESVTVVSVSGVEVIPPTVNGIEGDRIQLRATVQDEKGQPLEGAAVVWTSSEPAVASVDANGMVEAHAPGSAKVRATFKDVSGQASVVVSPGPSPPPPPPTRLAITQQPPGTQPLLSTFTLQVVAVDANGIAVPGYTGPVTIRIDHDASLLGNARLEGATTVNAVGGVATFSRIRVDQPGNGYTLRAGADGLSGVTSAAFSVVL